MDLQGYVYDEEYGLYYLQSRYYNPQVGRFLNADALIVTGLGLTDYNMFAYCGNMPVNSKDQSGTIRKLFGAEVTVVYQQDVYTEEYVPPVANLLVTVEQGSYISTTTSQFGDSSGVFSAYAEGRSDNWALSSIGANVNVDSFSLGISLGLDDISLSATLDGKDGTTNGFAIIVDLSELKAGIEFDKTRPIMGDENLTETTYFNASVTVIGILALAMAVMQGDVSVLFQQF